MPMLFYLLVKFFFFLAFARRCIITGFVPHEHFIDAIIKGKKRSNKAQSVALIRGGIWSWVSVLERDTVCSSCHWGNGSTRSYVGGEIRREWSEHAARHLGDLLGSLRRGGGGLILPLIYLFICTAHPNKRASREATSAWQRSHFLTQENCFLAS